MGWIATRTGAVVDLYQDPGQVPPGAVYGPGSPAVGPALLRRGGNAPLAVTNDVLQSDVISGHIERLLSSGDWQETTTTVKPGEMIRIVVRGGGCVGQRVRIRCWGAQGQIIDDTVRSEGLSCTAFTQIVLPTDSPADYPGWSGGYEVRIDTDPMQIGAFTPFGGNETYAFEFRVSDNAPPPPKPPVQKPIIPPLGLPPLSDILFGRNTLLILGGLAIAGVVVYAVATKKRG